jgi:hypothetical protein
MLISIKSDFGEVNFDNCRLFKSKAGRIILKIEGFCSIEYSRFVWQMHSGKTIPKGWVIHHIDEDVDNNDISNLVIMKWSDHLSLHHKGKIVSDEGRKKMSDARKGKPAYNKGVPVSEESKEKNRLAHLGNTYRRGKKVSEEGRKKMSEAKKGKTTWMKGKKHSDDTKLKISESKKGQIPPNKGKKMSEEQKDKLREIGKKQFASEESRKKHSDLMKGLK